MISPQKVEGRLVLEPEIAQAMVLGDRRPYLVAVVVPDEKVLEEWSAAHGKPAALRERAADPDFQKHLGAAVDHANEGLAPPERVRRFLIAREPFGIENGHLTPTLKIRRHRVLSDYGEDLERLYEAGAGHAPPTRREGPASAARSRRPEKGPQNRPARRGTTGPQGGSATGKPPGSAKRGKTPSEDPRTGRSDGSGAAHFG
jgi:hypothetical protein